MSRAETSTRLLRVLYDERGLTFPGVVGIVGGYCGATIGFAAVGGWPGMTGVLTLFVVAVGLLIKYGI